MRRPGITPGLFCWPLGMGDRAPSVRGASIHFRIKRKRHHSARMPAHYVRGAAISIAGYCRCPNSEARGTCTSGSDRRNLNWEVFMNTLSGTLLAVAVLSTALSTLATPSFALGGCGPNRHRSSVTGRCVYGGQNQHWCLRHTGHAAVPGPHGTWICVR